MGYVLRISGGVEMKRCKYCGSQHKEFRDQVDKYGHKFHVIECPKGCHRVHSYISITNARKLWDKANELTKQDLYDDLIKILGGWFDNARLEQVRLKCKEWELKNENN